MKRMLFTALFAAALIAGSVVAAAGADTGAKPEVVTIPIDGIEDGCSEPIAIQGSVTEFAQFVTTPIDLGAATDQVFLSLYGTGIRGFSSAAAITATAGGVNVPVLGAAAHSEFAGMDQVNIGPLPRGLAGRGDTSIVLRLDGKSTNAVIVNVR